MTNDSVKISAFPKCYLETIARDRTMTILEWIEMAKQLDADGLEMYDGFFTSLDDAYIDSVGEAISDAGFAMPMMCCSPDFTTPNEDEYQQILEREAEMIRITRRLGGPSAACRVLTGQRYPNVPLDEALERVISSITQMIDVAREHNVVLALENHYKDGHWKYPEFAQKQDVFLKVLEAVPASPHFGVQYDPSNAIVAGDDPIELLKNVAHRTVTMHASDRYLVEGATLDDIRQTDGTIGYSPKLQHGVTGKGLNDYDAIFSILRDAGFRGWISIEDGMNGMGEMQESIDFLKHMCAKYFNGATQEA
jgi:sugar phosphate isomerase/epimerase